MFKKIKTNLIQVGNKEPLNWFSILVLIALDIFIIFNLFYGLDVQQRQLTSPWEKVTHNCEAIFNSKINNDKDKISFVYNYLKDSRGSDYSRHYYLDNNSDKKIEECRNLESKLDFARNNIDLKNKINDIKNLNNDVSNYQRVINTVKNDYNTNLLEKIARQDESKSITENNSLNSRQKKEIYESKIKNAKGRISSIESSILWHVDVKNVFNYISSNKIKVNKILDNEKFWYPLKSFGVQLIFLIPLFIIFWLIYLRVSRNGSSISTLIFSHALVITFIPIFFGILQFIYGVIPHKFLAGFLKVLEDLNLEVLIFPLMILGGILGAMFLIYIVQKKLFNKRKTRIKRISKKQCPYCGVNISEHDLYCYNCGEIQYVKCAVCDKTTKKNGLYCTHCGVDSFKEKKED